MMCRRQFPYQFPCLLLLHSQWRLLYSQGSWLNYFLLQLGYFTHQISHQIQNLEIDFSYFIFIVVGQSYPQFQKNYFLKFDYTGYFHNICQFRLLYIFSTNLLILSSYKISEFLLGRIILFVAFISLHEPIYHVLPLVQCSILS